MRTFIAIELPKNVLSELRRLQSELKLVANGRFVPVESMHITLRFLGEITDLAGAAAAMDNAARDIRPFSLHLGGYTCFDKSDSKTSLVSVLGDTHELSILYDCLQAELFDEGFSREYRRYVPHITLGRNVRHDELVTAQLAAMRLDASMLVSHITLFESVREKGGMVYRPLHKTKFGA